MADTPAFSPRPRTVAACLLVAATVLLTGCVQSADTESRAATTTETADPQTTTDTTTWHDDAESRLGDLAAADDPETFADSHGIAYDDGRVSVVVTLREGAAFPDGPDAEVEVAHEGTVQASVAVADLRTLVAHEDVSYVRTQREPNA